MPCSVPTDTDTPVAPFPVEFSIVVDTAVFPRDVVVRACYAFTDRCWCWLQAEGPSGIAVAFRRKDEVNDPDIDPNVIRGDFANALIDFALRARIEADTRTVRDVIVAAALTEAGARPAAACQV